MNILYDIFQHYKINKVEAEVESYKQTADRLRNEFYALNNRIDALALAIQALWELLKEQTGLTDEQLIKKLEEIDLRDGVADGKITPRPVACPNCGRNISSKRSNCLYCGHEMPPGDVLGGI